MTDQWVAMRNLIDRNNYRKDVFLSLIGEEGEIFYANSFMIQSLDLKNPRYIKTNFYDLVHPIHIEDLRSAIQHASKGNNPYSIELYLKIGRKQYMKWNIKRLDDNFTGKRVFLCEGYHLLDKTRMELFDELNQVDNAAILTGLDHAILVHSPEGELVFANQQAAKTFETGLDTLYQTNNIIRLWNTNWNITTGKGDPVPFDETPFMKTFQKGEIQMETLRFRFHCGKEKSLQFKCQPLYKPDQSLPFSVVSSISEVRDEKPSFNTARAVETMCSAFMKNSPTLLWLVDENARLVCANPAFYHYFGLSEKNIGDRITSHVPGAVANALYENHLEVAASGKPFTKEQSVKWADGREYNFLIHIFPAGEENGKKLLGGHAIQLADKFVVEKQLREANEQMLVLNRASFDAIWEWDIRKDQTFRNETLLDMIGFPFEQTSGLSWWLERIHPEDRERVRDTVRQATDLKQVSWEESYRFECGDGSFKHIRDRGFIIYDGDAPVKMIGSLQDISVLIELENRLNEERIQKHKEISETVIQVQERERSRIGHELHDNINQILTTVLLFVNMLNPEKEAEKKIKNKIHEYVCLSIDEIRKLSKELVAPRLKEEGLIESIRLLIEDIHISDTLKIKFNHDFENLQLSQAKKVTFFRIIQEQLKNILNHSGASQANISLANLQNAVKLVINDNGIGFDSNQTFRGIGLSNIHERTRFYNGKIDIDTSPGKGCTLTVVIPI